MTEIVYRGEWPDDVKRTVEFFLEPYVDLIPGWCRILYVRFESIDADSMVSIRVCYENRWATMRVSPDWLEELPDDRSRALIHEIVHIHVQPMRTVFVDVTAGMDEQLKEFAWERFREAWEGATEDLTWAFFSTQADKPSGVGHEDEVRWVAENSSTIVSEVK